MSEVEKASPRRQNDADETRRGMFAVLLGIGAASLMGCAGERAEESDGEEQETNSAAPLQGTAGAATMFQADSVSALRALAGAAGAVAVLEGYTAPGDGGGGVFYWSTTAATDDDGTVLNAGGFHSTAPGWRRLYDGAVSVKWFGARGDGAVDKDDYLPIFNAVAAVTSRITSAGTSGPGVVFFPKGVYRVTKGFVFNRAVTLMGEGEPPNGIYGHASGGSTILHDFVGDLFTFDGDDVVNGVSVSSGGGIERLRITQAKTGISGTAGTAIVVKANHPDIRPSWVKIKLVNIDEVGGALSWSGGILVDGTNSADGIPNVFISEITTHISAGQYVLKLIAATSPYIFNCQFAALDACVIAITGRPDLPSGQVQMMNVSAGDVNIDRASDTAIIGGYFRNITTTANTVGQTLLMPSRLDNSFSNELSPGVPNPHAGLLHYDQASASFVFSSGIKYGKPLVAPGGAGAAALGTIGGSGPTSASQNGWLQLTDSTGARCWLPVWK